MKQILIILLIILVFSGFSQNISVASFKALPNDMSARIDAPKKDKNGNKCAIIKVVTTETNFSWDLGSIGIVDVQKKLGEYWIYAPNGAKRLTISHAKLGILRNYFFPEAIKEAMVYEIVLTTKKVTTIIEEVKIASQWLIINTVPSEAEVYVDDKLVGTTPFQRKFKTGEHIYRIELERYVSQAGRFVLDSFKQDLTFELKPKFADISITSSPEEGMDIYIDGKYTGQKTPTVLESIDNGEHTIKLQSKWYQAKSKKVEVVEGKGIEVTFALDSAFAEISITTQTDAIISIDSVVKGNGNWKGRLLEGIYSIKIIKDKYYTQEKEVEVKIGQNDDFTFDLIGKKGSVDITSTPMKANIMLNGKKYGNTPITISDLLIGNYSLTLEKKGYNTIRETIQVVENKTIEIHQDFSRAIESTIKSVPTGAKVYIDDKFVGKTPLTKGLPEGKYSIKLIKDEQIIKKELIVKDGVDQANLYTFKDIKKEKEKLTEVQSISNDGPSNAFLSVLVPGLGVKKVTHGDERGYERALWVYGLLGTGLMCKIYSNNEYEKYHQAITQEDMDLHYDEANMGHLCSLILFTAGFSYWAYDIAWVAYKGYQNKNKRNSQFGFYYNPQNNGLMLSYKLNF